MENKGTTIYGGIDVHKKSWEVQLMSNNTTLKRFRMDPPSAVKLASLLKREYPGMEYKCAYEAGFSGFGLQRSLSTLGIETIVVHPADIPTTDWEKRNKTDKIDCRKIANSLRSGMIKGIYIPTKQQEKDRSLVRYRYSIASDIRKLKNRITSHLAFIDIDFGSKKNNYWSRVFISEIEQFAKQNKNKTLILMLEHLCIQRNLAAHCMKDLRDLSKSERYKHNFDLLLSIPGVGLLTAMVFLTELGNIDRFKDDDNYISYIGLVPGTHSSGENHRVGSLTKRGNKRVRTALVLSAWMSIRSSPKMLAAYESYRSANMVANKSIIKIAKKLALIMRAVLRDKVRYDPFK